MYLTILDHNNKPIMSAKLKHFSLHTSACESYISRLKYSNGEVVGDCNAVYNTYLNDVEIHQKNELLEFERIHRLDHTSHFSGSHNQDDRSFYAFIQPILRGDYYWNITETGYRK